MKKIILSVVASLVLNASLALAGDGCVDKNDQQAGVARDVQSVVSQDNKSGDASAASAISSGDHKKGNRPEGDKQ